MSGYQRLKMAPNSPLSVRTRVCNNKWAPSLALYQHSCYQPQSSYISLQASWICCCQVTEDRTFTDLQGLRNF